MYVCIRVCVCECVHIRINLHILYDQAYYYKRVY